MSHRAEILRVIEDAMTFSCDQSELFTDAKSEPIAAEYLFTVAVAKKIAELNGPPGDPYIIRVERDAETFAKDCLSPMIVGSGQGFRRKMIFRKGKPDVGRKGRVDVTVYVDKPNSGYWGHQPLCAIEVKGFQPAKELVIEDLARNLSFLRATGNTGSSVLEFTVFAAFHSYKRTSDRWVKINEDEVKKKYESYLNLLGGLSDIDSEVIVKRVSLDQLGSVTSYEDYDEIDISKRHHIVGAMVVMSRIKVGLERNRGVS